MADEDDVNEELEEDDLEDNPEPEIEIKTPKRVNPDQEKDYLIQALESGDDNVKAWVKYTAIGIKQKEGNPLTDEEKLFMEDMNKLYELERHVQEQEQRREEDDAKLKAKVLEEYNIVRKADPSKIVHVTKADRVYRGGDSFPKLLSFALAMKKVKKKGGKVLVKITRDRQFFIEWTNKDISFVTFQTKDEKGNTIPEVTRFQEYKYTYEGSPVPVLFAVQGFSNGFDFFDKYKKDITSEMVSRIASRAYHSGYLEGVNLRDKDSKKDPFGFLTPFLPIIIIGGFLIMIYLLWQNYQATTDMLAQVQQIHAASVPIDINSVVVR